MLSHMYNTYVANHYGTIVSNGNMETNDSSSHASWSSLVGIVTSIVGNILISIALNTQRYAHVRIDREYNEGQGKKQKPTKLPKSIRNYGTTTQEEIANERSRLNAEAPGPGCGENEETNISGDNQKRKQSFSSDDTANSQEKNDSGQNTRKSYLKSPIWWVGIVLMAVGETGNFLAYGFAPASIVSPLGVVALISNCLIAPLMLKERFRKRDFWGVLISIGGAVTVVLSANPNETRLGPQDLWHAIKRWEFLTYIGITLVLIVVLMFASPRYGENTILIDLGLMGLFGGYTALSTKGVASMLSGSLWKALTFPITYALIAVLVSSAIMQIRYINRALSNFDSTQVIPVQFVLFTLSVIIGSAVLYRDFEKTDLDHVIKFVLGCALTFSGVWLITSGRKNSNRDDPDENGPHDETIHLIDEEAEMEEERTHSKQEHPNQTETSFEDRKSTRRQSTEGTAHNRPTVSPSIPSVAVTPYDEDVDQNPWLSSTEQFDHTARPRTPITPSDLLDPDRTQFFTPSSAPSTTRPPRTTLLSRTETSPADPQTPIRPSRTASPPKPDQNAIVPSDIPQTPPSTLFRSARGSISRLLPGPFLGPLSSSALNTVVADSLLKGEGSPRGPIRANSYRRSRPPQTMRAERGTRRYSATATSRAEVADLESGLSRWRTGDSAVDDVREELLAGEGSSSRPALLPSFSPSLTRLINKVRDRGKDGDGDGEEGTRRE